MLRKMKEDKHVAQRNMAWRGKEQARGRISRVIFIFISLRLGHKKSSEWVNEGPEVEWDGMARGGGEFAEIIKRALSQ